LLQTLFPLDGTSFGKEIWGPCIAWILTPSCLGSLCLGRHCTPPLIPFRGFETFRSLVLILIFFSSLHGPLCRILTSSFDESPAGKTRTEPHSRLFVYPFSFGPFPFPFLVLPAFFYSFTMKSPPQEEAGSFTQLMKQGPIQPIQHYLLNPDSPHSSIYSLCIPRSGPYGGKAAWWRRGEAPQWRPSGPYGKEKSCHSLCERRTAQLPG